MPPTRPIDILQPTRRNPPRAAGNPYASPPQRLLSPPPGPEALEAREIEVAETLTNHLPIINYDHLPRPLAATHEEGTMSDRIGWVLTHPNLEDQVR